MIPLGSIDIIRCSPSFVELRIILKSFLCYSKYNEILGGIGRLVLSFYWYPKCGTCRQAKKWLDAHQLDYKAIHIVENPPTSEELEAIYKNSQVELKKFFNTSGNKYRELGLKDKIGSLTEKEQLNILASDGMLIKRPLITDGHKVTFGFKKDEYEKTWLK